MSNTNYEENDYFPLELFNTIKDFVEKWTIFLQEGKKIKFIYDKQNRDDWWFWYVDDCLTLIEKFGFKYDVTNKKYRLRKDAKYYN